MARGTEDDRRPRPRPSERNCKASALFSSVLFYLFSPQVPPSSGMHTRTRAMDALMLCGTKQEEEEGRGGRCQRREESFNKRKCSSMQCSPAKVGPKKLPLPLHRFPRFKIAPSLSLFLPLLYFALNLCLPRFHSAKKSPLSFL